jgi:hypothetical protein
MSKKLEFISRFLAKNECKKFETMRPTKIAKVQNGVKS